MAHSIFSWPQMRIEHLVYVKFLAWFNYGGHKEGGACTLYLIYLQNKKQICDYNGYVPYILLWTNLEIPITSVLVFLFAKLKSNSKNYWKKDILDASNVF